MSDISETGPAARRRGLSGCAHDALNAARNNSGAAGRGGSAGVSGRRPPPPNGLAALLASSLGGSLLERLMDAPLNPDMRFNAFLQGGANRTAFRAARRVAMQETPPYNPLLIVSGAGNGKSHLIQALTRRRRSLFPNLKSLHISGEGLASELIYALRRRQDDSFSDMMRALNFLAIDDLEGLAHADVGQKEIAALIEEMLARGGVVAASAGRPPGQLELDKSLMRLFRSSHLAPISAPEPALRLAALEARVDQARRRGRPLAVSRSAVRFVARELPANFGTLYAALAHLAEIGETQSREVDVSTTQEALRDLLREAERRRRLEAARYGSHSP